MIRSFQPADLDTLMRIWLEGNLDAHPFIPAGYWRGQAEAVRGMLPGAELLIYDAGGGPEGFLGLYEGEIAGLFVRREARSRGIGHALLSAAKERYPSLTLRVYRENRRARAFYAREGFFPCAAQTDAATGAAEYLLRWTR